MLIGGGGGLAAMSGDMTKLKDTINSGDVTFTEEAAEALKSGMKDLQKTLRSVMAKSARLSQEPPIGQTPAAKVFKPFLATVATDADQGFVPVLKKMLKDADDIVDAIDKSAKSTQATDEGAGADMDGIA